MSDFDVLERLERYVENHPKAGVMEVLAATGVDPVAYRDVVEQLLDGDGDVSEPTQSTTDGVDRDDQDDAIASVDTRAVFTGAWASVDFASTASSVYPEELHEQRRWMGRGGESGKQPFAPWGDENAPAECSREGHETAETCGCDARWKWGYTDHYVTGDHLEMFLEDPKYRRELDGRVFIQLEDDPYAFVDGDDVRCPETGAVHPAFRALLEQLGLTYADVSTSGSGVHAYYRGDLPIDGKGQATFEIDTEPWGSNDSPPVVEIYANKHVNVATGEHVEGTPLEVTGWDRDALRAVLQANGYEDEQEVAHDTDADRPDLEGHTPEATSSTETANDVRDILYAVDRLTPRDVPLRSRQTGQDSTGWSTWNPSYRSSTSGKSLHYNGEGVFYDHQEGEEFGVLALYAVEQGIISNPWDDLAGAEWWEAVEAARDAGAPIPAYESGTEAVSTLPLERLDALDTEERKRYARSHGVEWPSTSKVRDRLERDILTAVRSGSSTVIDAPTSVGKSYTVATTPWLNHASTTNEQPVVHLHKTRDARDAAAAASSRAGVSYRVLKGRKERCPVAAGDHDPNPDGDDPDVVITLDGTPAREWFDAVCDGKGVPFSVAHRYLAENNDQGVELPCEADGAECPAMSQWDGIPWDDDGKAAVDVIHATHEFAYVPSLRRGTNVIIDEQPDYSDSFSQDRVRRMVNAYLREVGAPVSNFEAFVILAQHGGYGGDAAAEKDALDGRIGREPAREWFVSNPDAHALAPDLVKAIWNAFQFEDPDSNGRRSTSVYHDPPRFDVEGDDGDGDGGSCGAWLTVVIDDDHTVRTVRTTPSFNQARSVVGLDAHPSMDLWLQNTVPDMDRTSLLDPTERQLWRRFERGLTVVQVGEWTRPFTSGEYFDESGTEAVLEHLREHYGREFSTCITASSVERQTEELMKDVGISEPETMHYGEEKSRNDFGDESIGLVNGCIDPGDDYVLNLLSECGLEAWPATVETDDGEVKREKGRTFDGPDADAAADLLASVRENHVAQAAGRYARDADDPDNSAIVFVRTTAVPPELVDVEATGVERVFTDLQREILEVLRDRRDGATTKEIAEAVDCSKSHVRKYLTDLEGVTRLDGAGKYGADVYDADDVPENGEVDLSLEAFADESVIWVFAVYDHLDETAGIAPDTVADPSAPPSPADAVADGDDPPDKSKP